MAVTSLLTGGLAGASGRDDAPRPRVAGAGASEFLRVLDRAPLVQSSESGLPPSSGSTVTRSGNETQRSHETRERRVEGSAGDAKESSEVRECSDRHGEGRPRSSVANALQTAWDVSDVDARADALRRVFPEIDPKAVAFDLVAAYDDPLEAIDHLRQWFAIAESVPGGSGWPGLAGDMGRALASEAGAHPTALQSWLSQLGAGTRQGLADGSEGLGSSWMMRAGNTLAALAGLDPAMPGPAGRRPPAGMLAALLEQSLRPDAVVARGLDLDAGRLSRGALEAVLPGTAASSGDSSARTLPASAAAGFALGLGATVEGQARVLDLSRLLGAPDAMGRQGLDAATARGLVERMRLLVGAGGGLAEVRLHPPQLGSVDLKVHMDGDRVHVQFLASQAVTRDLLETHLPRLREALENGGLTLGDTSVGQRDAGDDARQMAGSSADSGGDRGAEPASGHSQPVDREATGTAGDGVDADALAGHTTLEHLKGRLDLFV